ncbi:MAG: SCO family protein [Devosia sp.]|jgi:protein SCO1/2|uniref:SCO family protein n=1 Tax=Devosia sp. TaxID=1871048 RepID=UPI0037C0E212
MSQTLSRVRLGLWAAVLVAAVAATILFVVAPPKSGGGIGGGTYALVDQRGNPIDQTMLVGQPSLLFFGYTHCPDVCPTTMGEMAGWFETLGTDVGTLKAYFVTVDPTRDTPEMLNDYVSWVSDRITGVTGDPAQIDRIVKAWAVLAEKVPGAVDGDYTVNHTASVFLVNPKGEFEGTIAYGEDQATAVAKIRKLLGKA